MKSLDKDVVDCSLQYSSDIYIYKRQKGDELSSKS